MRGQRVSHPNPLPAGRGDRARAYVLVKGIVQGVGFRPFVHRIASAHTLNGWVLNSTEGVEIEVEGGSASIRDFLADLAEKAPPLAAIHKIDVHYLPPAGYSSFIIETSHESGSGFPLVSPDIATCPECLGELLADGDRRHRYPFINCTNCGPRYTIVEGVPYDRTKTTMRAFAMCPACQSEYDDPTNRRFHAQPNACPACGPSVWLCSAQKGMDDFSEGRKMELPVDAPSDCIEEARRRLNAGRILAVKGIGGFHLACDAANANAVRLLRQRKRRVEKPFAIMVRDLEAARRLCCVDDAEAQLLTSARRPIVLLERKPESPVAEDTAPHNRRLGVMLPYTPLHHLLLAPAGDTRFAALVMTSGNFGEEPIAKDNDEARTRLSSLADDFLMHNRPIHVRCDDSVTQVFDGRETIIRRSRGYAPLPLRLGFALEPVLACGAQLKNTFCLAEGSNAFLSQHIGDLENQETLGFFRQCVDHLLRLLNLSPRVIAHDLHPDYLSTRYGLSFERPSPATVVAVQHHHAHIASCMAENGLSGRAIGVAFDGTGYGSDGAIWGGEFLVAGYTEFERAAHLKYLPLPGGEAAIRRPYRMALSYLVASYGDSLPDVDLLATVDPYELAIVKTQVSQGINSPPTSSCGRLFDAVSALLGIRGEVNYEGQAAIEMEMAARADVSDAYSFQIDDRSPLEIDPGPVIHAIVDDLARGETRDIISSRFHNGVAQMIVDVCAAIRRRCGLERVVLSGGVFQNRYLLSRTLAGLARQEFEVYIHHLVPCNDGGIALGQAVVASSRTSLSHA
ncbi:MAG: carbamoyltransferase HypF [Chloroflexi bacterium]|nr:carbamoyltransferase HypF [Chloroflexota bacterium]